MVLVALVGVAFRGSQGNTLVIGYVDAAGWGATVTNPAVTALSHDVCGVYVGSLAAHAAAAGLALADIEGAPKCY